MCHGLEPYTDSTLCPPAVNKQMDIIFDGTMTWAPFVEQTVAMVRDHHHNYHMGPGYQTDEAGNVTERWVATGQQLVDTCIAETYHGQN